MKCKHFLAFFGTFLVSVITFAGFLSVDSSAAYEGGQFMTANDFREILGDDIVCEYFNGTEYKEAHFYYYNTVNGLTMRDESLTDVSSYQLLRYTSTLPNLSYSNEFITVHLSPKFAITDTKVINTFIGMRTQYDISDSAYNQSVWDWNFSGNTLSFTAPAYNGNYRNAYIGGNNYCVIPVQMSSDQLTSGYSFDVKFYGAGAATNAQLIIGVPYISSDASVVEGTLPPVTTAPSGGDINVSVDVDMSETNGILGSIWDAITGIPDMILDGLSALFVPEDGFLTDKVDSLQESFAWYEDLVTFGTDLKSAFSQSTTAEAPVITLHSASMVSAWSGYNYMNDDEVLLDLGDFAEYKSSIQTILSVLLWVFFLWRLFARLPDIISGSGMIIGDSHKIAEEMDKRHEG